MGTHDPDVEECLLALAKTPNAWRLGGGIDALRNMAKGRRMSEGKLIYEVLRVFYGAMLGGDVNYAMACVCELYWRINRIAAPMTVNVLAERLRDRSAGEWQPIAMGMSSDAQVALAGWIESWNRKQIKMVSQYNRKIRNLH